MPDLGEGVFAQVSKRLVCFAYRDVAVGVDHARQSSGGAGNNLSLLSCRANLRPLQHRLDNRSESTLFTRRPQRADVIVEILVTVEHRTAKAWVFSVTADDREIVMIHRWASLVEKCCQRPNLIDVDGGRRRDGVNPETRIPLLQLGER